jgi:hypothetical protein
MVRRSKERKQMFQLNAATIALALETTIGMATLIIGGAMYQNAIDALARTFG